MEIVIIGIDCQKNRSAFSYYINLNFPLELYKVYMNEHWTVIICKCCLRLLLPVQILVNGKYAVI